MKKTILKAMLFFAFLAIGLQSASAQYVTSDDATILLTAEIQSTTNLMANLSSADKLTQATYLTNKIKLFNFVKDQIGTGATVEVSVKQGARRFRLSTHSFSNGPTTGKNPIVAPLHQEILDLLTL